MALLIVILANASLSAQSIQSCVPNTSPPGNTVTVTITGTNVDFNSGTPLVALEPAVGPTIYSNVFTPLSATTMEATFNIPLTATLGDYAMEIGFGMVPSTPAVFSVLNASNLGTISGRIFHDVDENCVKGNNEPDLSGFAVHLTPGNYYAMTGVNGEYNAYVPPGTYDVEVTPPTHYSRLCPASSISATINAAGDTDSGNDFAMDVDSVTDGSISCSSGEFRPGFNTVIAVQVQNIGVIPFTGTAQIILDDSLTYLNSSPAATVSGDTVSWPITPALAAGGVLNFTVTVNTPVNTPLGTTITNETSLITNPQDFFIENNSFTCTEVVIGSYDPNDKTVWNEEMQVADPEIDPTDSVLIYRIRFQNTGTASAINIFIRDTLDPMLDPGSLEMLGTSHLPYSMNMSGNGAVEWRFPDINLPDSTSNEPASHGFVLFKIKTRPSFTTGMFIRNKASIYFDFNAPIVTNEVSTSIVVSIDDPNPPLEIQVFPNPASDMLHVELDCSSPEGIDYRLLDAFGSTLREVHVPCVGGMQRLEVPVDALPSGIYFLEAALDGKQATYKVAITR